MVSYKFENDAAEFPIETHEGDFIPEGFVAFDGGRVVEWANEKRVEGKIATIKKPEPPAPYEPTAEEVERQKLQQLDWEYEQQSLELTRAWVNATIDKDETMAVELAEERAALKADYATKREAIVNAGN